MRSSDRPQTEDAVEFVGGGLVDRQPPEIQVGTLQDIRTFRHIGKNLALGETSATRRSSVSLRSRSARCAKTWLVVSWTAQNIPAPRPQDGPAAQPGSMPVRNVRNLTWLR
jgi:hypothetical protein